MYVAARESLTGYRGCLEKAFLSLEESRASQISTLSRDDCTLASARFDVPREEGKGYWEFLRLGPDIFAIVCNALYPKKVTIPVAGEDWIEFHFRLSGELQLVEGQNSIEVSQGTLLIWRQPRGCDIVEHLSGYGNPETSVTFYCRPSFFRRNFGDLVGMIEDDLVQTLGMDCDCRQLLRAVLYPSLSRLIVDFAAISERPGIELVKAECQAVQIIGETLLNAHFHSNIGVSDNRLSDLDVKCLRAARQILIKQNTPPPKIKYISRKVGMSATRLKYGFRTLFGQTISEFSNDLRMSAAKELLRKNDRSIAQVSAELGYEYQNSFTVAFRRKWGVLPRDYRQNPLIYDQGHGASENRLGR